MKDVYPALPTLPAAFLVPPEQQPEYIEPPGYAPGAEANIATAILDAAPTDAVALIAHERREEYTFGDLRNSSAHLAEHLRHLGVQPGERVAVRSGNRPEAVVAALAAWRVGAIVVPTPPQARASELRFLLEDTAATTLITDGSSPGFEEVPEALEGNSVKGRIVFDAATAAMGWEEWVVDSSPRAGDADVPVSSSLPALIWHTGGTTGVPKACYHTHRRYLLAGWTFRQATGVGRGDRWLTAAPIGHALGFLCHTSYTLLHGASAVMVEGFASPRLLLESIAAHEVDTVVAIAATWGRLLEQLVESPELDRISSLRRAYAMWQSASSGAVYDKWCERGIELLNNFGSTAFANWILVPQDGETPRASLGSATPGYDVRAIASDSKSLEAVDPGTIGRMAVRGPTGLTYWNRHAEQARDVVDGWTLSDDLIEFDAHGNAAYLGRTDFVISTAGYKVAPVEVEEALSKHPAVKEVGVVGTPDPDRLEIVAAFVVVSDGFNESNALKKELQDFVKASIAPHKYPRRIEFVEILPRDAVGKLLPRTLQEWAQRNEEGVPA